MNNLRKEIIQYLNEPLVTTDLYDQLKCCLILDERYEQDINSIDDFFIDSIKSLFYRPSNYGLVLQGPSGIGKTEFFKLLLPNENWFSPREDQIYEKFLIDCTDAGNRIFNKTIASDGFNLVHTGGKTTVVKRLANMVFTSNRTDRWPSKERLTVLYLKDIDRYRFNIISKECLWIEIYHRFLEKYGIFKVLSDDDVNQYFR